MLAAAASADEVILGSYMAAAGIARHIRARVAAGAGDLVTIVAMGFEGIRPSVEDERCGDYIEHLLLEGDPRRRAYDHVEAVSACLSDPEIAASLRGEHAYRPKEDIVLALQRDLFDFAMVGCLEDGHVRVTRVPAPSPPSA